jgi:hypothetical protein
MVSVGYVDALCLAIVRRWKVMLLATDVVGYLLRKGNTDERDNARGNEERARRDVSNA